MLPDEYSVEIQNDYEWETLVTHVNDIFMSWDSYNGDSEDEKYPNIIHILNNNTAHYNADKQSTHYNTINEWLKAKEDQMTIVIPIASKAQSTKVQQELFAAGIVWCCSGKAIRHRSAKYIAITDNELYWGNTIFDAIKGDSMKGNLYPTQILNPDDVSKEFPPLEDMIMVDGKEYSESTIKKALQEYVK